MSYSEIPDTWAPEIDSPARAPLAEFLLTEDSQDIEIHCQRGFGCAQDSLLAELEKGPAQLSPYGIRLVQQTIEEVRLNIDDGRMTGSKGVMPTMMRGMFASRDRADVEVRDYIFVSHQLLLRVCNAFLDAEDRISPEVEEFGGIMSDATEVCTTIGLWDKITAQYHSEWSTRRRRTFAAYMGLCTVDSCLEDRFGTGIVEDGVRDAYLEEARQRFADNILADTPSKASVPGSLRSAFQKAIDTEADQAEAYKELSGKIRANVEPETLVPLDQRRRRHKKPATMNKNGLAVIRTLHPPKQW